MSHENFFHIYCGLQKVCRVIVLAMSAPGAGNSQLFHLALRSPTAANVSLPDPGNKTAVNAKWRGRQPSCVAS